jgi:hypothetical protein
MVSHRHAFSTSEASSKACQSVRLRAMALECPARTLASDESSSNLKERVATVGFESLCGKPERLFTSSTKGYSYAEKSGRSTAGTSWKEG